jgi:hypothetical protein
MTSDNWTVKLIGQAKKFDKNLSKQAVEIFFTFA